jgi:phosphohistidine phosphatase SixA
MPTVQRRTLLRQLGALSVGGLLAVGGLPAAPSSPVRASAGPAADAWDALAAGGHVALIRHAEAPGVGDPPSFTLGDCSTQRNLSAGGRAQAGRLGATFRERGAAPGLVLTSAWCRCVDTAVLAFGAAEVWPALNSFFQNSSTQVAQTAELRAGVAAWAGPGTLVLVTHQVNITALTDIFPASGEIVVLAPGPESTAGFTLVGRVSGY